MDFLNSDVNLIETDNILKVTKLRNEIVDAWVSESGYEERVEGNIFYRTSNEGIFGVIEYSIDFSNGHLMEEITASLYTEIFRFMNKQNNYKLVRMWNYIPKILDNLGNDAPDNEVYRWFNRGRFNAFLKHYGENRLKWIIPAASGVGSSENIFKIEFFASTFDTSFVENKNQIPAYQYSNKYGKLPPVFSRGALWKYKEESIFFASGTASILGEESVFIGEVHNQVKQSFHNILTLVSETNLNEHGINDGFFSTNLVLLRIYYKNIEDKAIIESEIHKLVPPSCKISLVRADICRENLLVEIEGIFKRTNNI